MPLNGTAGLFLEMQLIAYGDLATYMGRQA